MIIAKFQVVREDGTKDEFEKKFISEHEMRSWMQDDNGHPAHYLALLEYKTLLIE